MTLRAMLSSALWKSTLRVLRVGLLLFQEARGGARQLEVARKDILQDSSGWNLKTQQQKLARVTNLKRKLELQEHWQFEGKHCQCQWQGRLGVKDTQPNFKLNHLNTTVVLLLPPLPVAVVWDRVVNNCHL